MYEVMRKFVSNLYSYNSRDSEPPSFIVLISNHKYCSQAGSYRYSFEECHLLRYYAIWFLEESHFVISLKTEFLM
jgi:hypothetical protein